jgi:hypothetical protein
MKTKHFNLLLTCAIPFVAAAALIAAPATGPLRVSRENSRYFTDGNGWSEWLEAGRLEMGLGFR